MLFWKFDFWVEICIFLGELNILKRKLLARAIDDKRKMLIVLSWARWWAIQSKQKWFLRLDWLIRSVITILEKISTIPVVSVAALYIWYRRYG